MKDFVTYLCEVEPTFNQDKLKQMLKNEDMSQSEVQNLWRQVSALNRQISDGVNDDAISLDSFSTIFIVFNPRHFDVNYL